MIDSTFDVVNVVGTGRLPAELALQPLKEDLAGNAWENDSPQPGLHMRFVEDGPMTTFYSSGKYIIRAPSVDGLYDAEREIREEIHRLGIIESPDADTEFEISNVVAVAKLDRDEVNLIALTVALGLEHTEYEPEQFPALSYRKPEYPCTFLLFANGKIVIAGADDPDEAEDAFENFKVELDEWI
jgi:transcription initiation factor TFIID TATA-box-binding protein